MKRDAERRISAKRARDRVLLPSRRQPQRPVIVSPIHPDGEPLPDESLPAGLVPPFRRVASLKARVERSRESAAAIVTASD